MASEDRIPFLGDGDESVAKNVQLKDVDDGNHLKNYLPDYGSEIFGHSQTRQETETSIKSELITEGGSSGIDIREEETTDEQTYTVNANINTKSEVVDRAENSSAAVHNVTSKPIDVTENKISDEGNQNTTSTEAKQSDEPEMKVVVPSTSSEAQSADDRSKDSALWYIHVLLVRGLPPREAGNLKQLLNATLGGLGHRIKPRAKGDKVLYVHFKSEDEMKIAQSLLHNQNFLGYTLNAKVVSNEQQKRKALMIDEDYVLPPAKKIKPDPETRVMKRRQKQDANMLKFLEGTYEAQLHRKTQDVYVKLQRVAKLLRRHYPKYDRMIMKRELKYGGLICILDRFMGCPPNERYATRCKFCVGTDKETGRLTVGFHSNNGNVNKLSSVKHNYPPHVVEAAKVFEAAIRGWQMVSDADGIERYKFWHELVIRTNQAQDLMFVVYLRSPRESAPEMMKHLHEELKVFFESEEAKKCRITSIYTKVTYIPTYDAQQLTLAVGSPYLEEMVLDLKFHLLPTMRFWNNIHAAKMVCRGIDELLTPTKKIAVLEVGCGFGLIGLYLSKIAGEVLSMDTDHFVEEAKKHAEINEVTDCQYFGGRPEEVLPLAAAKITCNKACAIVISTSSHSSTCAKAMKELRKIPQVRRVVLVTEMFYTRFSPIMTLSKPTNANDMGYPFFPLRAIPVDTKPNGKGYMLLILMERIGLFSLLKTPGPSHERSEKTGRVAAETWKPYEVEAEYTELLLRGSGYT